MLLQRFPCKEMSSKILLKILPAKFSIKGRPLAPIGSPSLQNFSKVIFHPSSENGEIRFVCPNDRTLLSSSGRKSEHCYAREGAGLCA